MRTNEIPRGAAEGGSSALRAGVGMGGQGAFHQLPGRRGSRRGGGGNREGAAGGGGKPRERCLCNVGWDEV